MFMLVSCLEKFTLLTKTIFTLTYIYQYINDDMADNKLHNWNFYLRWPVKDLKHSRHFFAYNFTSVSDVTVKDMDKICWHLWPLLLTWFNFNPSMDK